MADTPGEHILRLAAAPRNVICAKCTRKGSKSGASMKCPGFQGSGMKVLIRQLGPGMIQQMHHPCNECKGTGESINDKDRCTVCKGEKDITEKKVLEVHVKKGMQNGHKITFSGETDKAPDTVTGDIVFVLHQKEHPKFKRKGDDLVLEILMMLYIVWEKLYTGVVLYGNWGISSV